MCYETRLRVLSLNKEAEILSGSNNGQIVYIPKKPMIMNESPFDLSEYNFT